MSQDIHKLFEESYIEAENKRELDYWEPLARMSSELIELLQENKDSLKTVAKKMNVPEKTLQEIQNLQHIPDYDFVEKLCHYFGQRPSVSLYGAYTATLSSAYHVDFEDLAKRKNRDPKTYLEEIIDAAVLEEIKKGG